MLSIACYTLNITLYQIPVTYGNIIMCPHTVVHLRYYDYKIIYHLLA